MKPFAICALALASAAFAQQPLQHSKIKFSDTTLDNGLRVLISEDHYAPVYAICIATRSARAMSAPDAPASPTCSNT